MLGSYPSRADSSSARCKFKGSVDPRVTIMVFCDMPFKNREDMKQYQRRWREKRRTEWITTNGPCRKCGSTKNLEIDHIDPRAKKISNILNLDLDRMEAA
jgi:hypothetical protein